MKRAAVPTRIVSYPGAVHGFTNPTYGTDNSKGVAYNAEADKESWQEMNMFLLKIFDQHAR